MLDACTCQKFRAGQVIENSDGNKYHHCAPPHPCWIEVPTTASNTLPTPYNGLYLPRIGPQKAPNGPANDISVPQGVQNLVGIESGLFEIVTTDGMTHFMDLDSRIFTFPEGSFYSYERVDGPQVGAPMVVKWLEWPNTIGAWRRTPPVVSIVPVKHRR